MGKSLGNTLLTAMRPRGTATIRIAVVGVGFCSISSRKPQKTKAIDSPVR